MTVLAVIRRIHDWNIGQSLRFVALRVNDAVLLLVNDAERRSANARS